jgi:multicomponent Na+:H+ antiporter subunit D
MIMGLGLYTQLAIAGSIFYIMHHIIVKANLFLVSGVAYRLKGTYELKKLGGLYQVAPGLGIMFLIPALSLAGMPPLSGFWAKLTLVQAGLEIESYLIVVAALTAGILTLFSMTKIWAEAFWKPDPGSSKSERPEKRSVSLMVIPIIGLALVTVTIGIIPAPFFDLAVRAAEQLLNSEEYIRAVLQTP